MYITASVGSGGKNAVNEVKFVQELINLIAESDLRIPVLDIDGKCGKNTVTAIKKYQQFIVKLKQPDGRIDPNGRSEKTLIAKAIELDKEYLAELLKKYKLAKSKAPTHEAGPKVISYQANAKKVLSDYTENVVKLVMSYAGVTKCDISSTIRTFDDQARIMYGNCTSFPAATSVATLNTSRGWGYAEPGRLVEAVYFENKSEDKSLVISKMKAKIEELYKNGKQVSLHCVSDSDYKKKNVLDIPYSSILVAKRRDFETALMGMANEIKNIRYKRPIQGEIYITRLIIEDKCWHLEITQNNKPIPNQKSVAVSQPKASKASPIAKAPIPPNALSACIKYLNQWF